MQHKRCKMIICYFAIFGFLWGIISAAELSPCTTPNGEATFCIPILKCMVLLQSACSNEPTALKFLNESTCSEESSTVCCGKTGNYTKSVTVQTLISEKEKFKGFSLEEKKDYVLKKLLPTRTICGLQHTDDYFYDAVETSVDEFPWLVYITDTDTLHDQEYYLRVESNCVGVLISKQYVLSERACGNYAPRYLSTGIDMLLGLHHIHKNVNCIGTPFGVDDCTDPPLRVKSYDWKSFEDIILIRLDSKVQFSDYVRPICLPQQSAEIPTPGSTVMASGWGEEEFVQGKSVKLKKRMKYTVMSNKDCAGSHPQRRVSLICGIPFENNTHYICDGDVGGPLMYRHNNKKWFAVGAIYQSTSHECDEAQPATAVKLTPEIVNWIIEHIEP